MWYAARFDHIDPSTKVTGEFSPSYFTHPLAPDRIDNYRSGMRIIVSLRDPVERAYSQHLHEIRVGHFSGSDLSFEAGMNNNPMYLEQSLYGKYLRLWLDTFPEDQIAIFFLEEISEDPQREMVRLCRFLGIDPTHQPAFLNRKANQSYLPKHVWLDKGVRSLGRAGRTLHLGRVVDAIRGLPVVRRLRSANRLDARQQVPPMLPETRNQLHQYFHEDQQQLKVLLQRDHLPWEKRN